MKPGQAGAARGPATTIVEAELSELTYLEAWRFSPTRRQIWRYWSVLPVLTSAAFLLGSMRAHEPAHASLVLRLMPSLVATALLAQEIFEVRGSWVDAVNRGLGFGPLTLRLDESWLELESELLHYRVRWTELAGCVDTPRSLLVLVQGGGPWLLIPKWPWSPEGLRALRARMPGPPSLPRFNPVRFCIGLSAVLVVCWCARNA